MTKKNEKIKPVKDEKIEEKPVKKFEITAEIMEQLLTGKLTSSNDAVNYLIGQLITAKYQHDQIKPQLQQKEEELRQLRKAFNDLVVRWDNLIVDITNLWPN